MIPHSTAATELFKTMRLMDESGDIRRESIPDIDPSLVFSWGILTLDSDATGEHYTIPMEAGSGGHWRRAVEMARQYSLSLSDEFAPAVELSPLQALEVKAHSLAMADVYSAIRPLITRTLLPTDFSGHIAVVNPYYSLILASLRLVKTNPRYANVDLLSGVPAKWRERRPIDTYRVAAMERSGEGGDEEQGIGIGLFHAPSVPAFDFSDVL
jgi:hypothetical protein